MTTQGSSTKISIQDFARKLAGACSWLCVIYAEGVSEDGYLEKLCADIGDVHQICGLCIVANVEDAHTMAVLSSTVEVANAYNAPIFSIRLGEEELSHGAVTSACHYHVSSVRSEHASIQYSFVAQVLREILHNIVEQRV